MNQISLKLIDFLISIFKVQVNIFSAKKKRFKLIETKQQQQKTQLYCRYGSPGSSLDVDSVAEIQKGEKVHNSPDNTFHGRGIEKIRLL